MKIPFWLSRPPPSEFEPHRPPNYAKLSKADQFIIDSYSINDQKIEWLMRTAVVNRNLTMTFLIVFLLTHALEMAQLVARILGWFSTFQWLQ
jgi:hypothetical protein